jgi:hypothetical protein
MIELIKKTYDKLFIKENSASKSYRFKSLIGSFQNIAQYDLGDLDTARIHTKDIIPHKYKDKINYRKEDLYTVIKTNKLLSESLYVEKEVLQNHLLEDVIEKIKDKLESKIIESIDEMILFSMSELGRITSSIYGQVKESIGQFTISNEITPESLIRKLEYADIVLKELNNIGLKHLIISRKIFSKIESYSQESKIKLNHKLVSYQLLPEHLEATNPLCIIATSQNYSDMTPGIVIVYKNLILDILENKKNDIVEFHLSKEYSIQNVGKKPEFFYIRFLQT